MIIFVVAEKSKQAYVSSVIDSLRNHVFLAQTDIRIVTPDEFEDTDCFKQIKGTIRLQENYKRLRSGKEKANLSLVDPTLNEQAVLLFAPGVPEKRTLLHEFGHCTAVKSRLGIDLRSEYGRVADYLDKAIGIQFSRTLAEVIILQPEEAWIERQIVEFAAHDEDALGITVTQYLENALELFSEAFKVLSPWDFAKEDWKRAQTALQRVEYCLKCILFSEIAEDTGLADLKIKFLELAKKFRDSPILVGISLDGLWSLTKGNSMKQWVDRCSSMLIRVVRSARM
jgi:hypothetical protein